MDTGRPTDNGVNDVTVKLNNVSLAREEVTPAVKIEVTEHEEDEGDTHTEVREVNTAKTEGGKVEETKEVTKVAKTSTPGGGQVTTQTTTKTTRKGFVGKETFFAKEMCFDIDVLHCRQNGHLGGKLQSFAVQQSE